MKRNDLSDNLSAVQKTSPKKRKARPPKKQAWVLARISIVENSFRPGMGLFVEKILQGTTHPFLHTRVVDANDIVSTMESFHPDVVILARHRSHIRN